MSIIDGARRPFFLFTPPYQLNMMVLLEYKRENVENWLRRW